MKVLPTCSDPKKLQGINPMVFPASWSNSDQNERKGPPNFDHQTLPTKPL